MDSREETIRATAEYVARMRKLLDDGRAEIERQLASLEETRDYLRREADGGAEHTGR